MASDFSECYYGAVNGSVKQVKDALKAILRLEQVMADTRDREKAHLGKANVHESHRRVEIELAAKARSERLKYAIVSGRNFLAVKELLPYGQFEKWVKEQTGLSNRTANRYMKLASTKSAPEKNGADLGLRVLELLTAKGVPEGALAEAKKRAEFGERITQKIAHEIVSKHTTPVVTNRIATQIEEVYGSGEPQSAVQVQPQPPVPVEVESSPKPLSDNQKLAKAMELIASMESPDTQYEAVLQTVALLHPEDRGELFSKLNSIYKQQAEPKQVELFAGDPADLVPPKKINTPEVRKAWVRWCDSNKAKGHPLTIEEGKSQLRLLATGKAETAVERIEYALATRSDKIPLARELPKDFEEPTEEAVLGYAKPVGVPESVARDFFQHYAAQGWVLGNGQPITDWKQSLHAWNKNQSDRSRPQIQSKFDEPDTPDPLMTSKWGKSRLTKHAG